MKTSKFWRVQLIMSGCQFVIFCVTDSFFEMLTSVLALFRATRLIDRGCFRKSQETFWGQFQTGLFHYGTPFKFCLQQNFEDFLYKTYNASTGGPPITTAKAADTNSVVHR